MKTLIHEIGVIDKQGIKHSVNFKAGLNVVTGKSSTGKSALIEIFDYCFGSDENTIPKGVITNSAAVYYVALAVNEQDMVIARDPDIASKAFFRRAETFNTAEIDRDYFNASYFRPLSEFKKHLRDFFLDIDDVDESLAARANRRFNQKAPTPSIRSFSSFMLQHQNLVANKHALFYRFDEKEKRDQAIEHTKIFLGLVDQKFFHLSQEKERLSADARRLERQKETNKRTSESYKQKVEPVLSQLYALMGFKDQPLSLAKVLQHPQDAKGQLDSIIVAEKINHNSDAMTQRYEQLKLVRNQKTAELRRLQRQSASINKHIKEEERFVDNVKQFSSPKHVHIAATVCPFCHTEKDNLRKSAEKLQQAIAKVSGNLAQARPMKAKFESSLVEVQRSIEVVSRALTELNQQITEVEKADQQLTEKKSLYESIIMQKAKLFSLLDTLNMADDDELEKEIKVLRKQLNKIAGALEEYDVQKGLAQASDKVNEYMAEIGSHFEFEASYKPINLHFSFETFDLYHLTPDDGKIYLRSMGSGANWLYCHITLFLALHKYFAELGEKCAIPSVLFLDQPTQVYFPNFNRDTSESFDEQKSQEAEQRKGNERPVDEDMKAVENLFSRLSIYCNELELNNGFSPQIIVTDHADDLVLTNNVLFESLVNGNRWRTRGLIHPVQQ
ncbi:ATPase [Pseudomonas sp. WN033]|nr:ATPase [Pseudomonas sp. WN033]